MFFHTSVKHVFKSNQPIFIILHSEIERDNYIATTLCIKELIIIGKTMDSGNFSSPSHYTLKIFQKEVFFSIQNPVISSTSPLKTLG
jgi:hypothetical protein